ncbi:MAG: hypothetical protein KKD99_10265 [Proteobacteria bacterium]|nr:hypothetical protein [Pseudomonadota bacterium]MBU4354727.1 hypothetical protein [Pseudomonadota bacterium]MBU4448962.1 hypothetical protein [Pseudomonadota bacterium]
MAPLTGYSKSIKTRLASCLLVLFLLSFSGEGRAQLDGEDAVPPPPSRSHVNQSQEAAFSQAQTLWNQRRWEHAVLAYEHYLRLHPQGDYAPQVYHHLGMYLEQHQRLDEALQYYQAGVARARDGKTRQILESEVADIQTRYGNLEEAIQLYQGILRQPASWEMFKIANKKLLMLHFKRVARKKQGDHASRCGQESLKTALTQLGVAPRDEVLKKIPQVQGNRISMESLKQAALAHGVKCDGLKSADGRLEKLSPPAILLLNPGHYVVFQGLTATGVKVFDPVAGQEATTVIPLDRFQMQWTGYALSFAPSDRKVQHLTRLSDQEMQNLFGGCHAAGSNQTNKGKGIPNTEIIDPLHIWVNSVSLNMILEDVDAVWPTMGDPLVLKRTYNSEDANTGMFGPSWRFSYEISLTVDTAGNATVTWGDGRTDLYTSKGDGTFMAPLGYFDRLVKNPDGTYSLWEKAGKFTYSFGADLRLGKISDPNGNALDLVWGPNGLTALIIHYGNTTKQITFTYGGQGRCTRISLPDGRFSTFSYSSTGDLITSADMEGYKTSYAYDVNKYITGIATPLGVKQILYQPSPANLNIYAPQKIITPSGNTFQFTVDGTDIVYTDGNGHQTRYTVDSYTAFTSKITNAAGGVTSFTYDSYGNRTSVTDPSGAKWVLAYDPDPSKGNLTKLTDRLGRSVTMTYSAYDDLMSVNAPLGRQSNFTYDTNHNLVKMTDSLSRETSFTYYSSGRLLQSTLSGTPNPVITFQYDAFGNLISETDPAGHITRYAYDEAGRVLSRTDANGNQTEFAYDKLSRLTRVSAPDGVVLYTFDSTDLREITAIDRRQMTFAYDKSGHIVNFRDIHGFLLHYAYDGEGNLTSLTYPGNKVVTYQYDNLNRLTSVTDWLGKTTTYTYDNVGNTVQIAYPNGTGAQLYYDSNHRLIVHQNYGVSGQPLPQFAYLLDDAGNCIGETRRYAEFAEPAWKNLASQYNIDDRLINTGSSMFQYDSNGNLISKTMGAIVFNYSYDYNNMMTQVQMPDKTYKYKYDPLLNRVSKQVGDDKKLLVVNPNAVVPQVMMQTNIGKNPTDYYIYGVGLLSRIDADGNVYYYHFNGLGSTVAVTDKDGNPVNRYLYDPFGKLLESYETFQNPFRYVGRYGVMDDDNDLLFMKARYYDSQLGRFIGKDPAGYMSGMNVYTYVYNNPLGFIDPLGLQGYKPNFFDKILRYGNWGGKHWSGAGWIPEGGLGQRSVTALDWLDRWWQKHDIDCIDNPIGNTNRVKLGVFTELYLRKMFLPWTVNLHKEIAAWAFIVGVWH